MSPARYGWTSSSVIVTVDVIAADPQRSSHSNSRIPTVPHFDQPFHLD
jgi:hypothetical protein